MRQGFPDGVGSQAPGVGGTNTWGVEVWTRTGFSRAGVGGYQQGVSQERLEDWELLDMQEQKAGIRIEAKAIRPPPTRRPVPGEVAGLDPKGLGL